MDTDFAPDLTDCITCLTIKNITQLETDLNTAAGDIDTSSKNSYEDHQNSPRTHIKIKCEDHCCTSDESDQDKTYDYDDDFEEEDNEYLCPNFATSVSLCSTSSKRNSTFKDTQLREIERNNDILMKKIISNNRRVNQYNVPPKQFGFKKTTSAAINRRRQEEKIARDNQILLRKIQSVKSTFKK